MCILYVHPASIVFVRDGRQNPVVTCIRWTDTFKRVPHNLAILNTVVY